MPTIQHGDAQNMLGNPGGQHQYSNFELKGHRFTTESFGRVDVCGVYNAIEADKVDWKPSHEITTYTLSAPLMQQVYKEKDYILVCRCAILPFNWDKIHTQPTIGDDINASSYGTSVNKTAWNKMLNLYKKWLAQANEAATPEDEETPAQTSVAFKIALQGLILGEYVLSHGALITKLGAHFASMFEDKAGRNYDDFFDWAIKELCEDIYGINVDVGDTTYDVNIKLDKEYLTGYEISIDEFLDIIRDSPANWDINYFIGSVGETITTEDSEWASTADRVQNVYTEIEDTTIIYSKPVDIARLWAYQLAVAEYMTNSHVDYIYSAELFRQAVKNARDTYFMNTIGETSPIKFIYNGLQIEADWLSAAYFNEMITAADNVYWGDPEYMIPVIEYLSMIFAFRRSLKYMDYFTGSKTRPLAVGDITLNPDLGGNINAIEVTRKGQAYRFLNAVQRIGRKAEDYALEIMGVKQKHDWHVPLWLGSTRSAINAEIVDNTGEAQMTDALSQTARLYGIEGKYMFQYDFDRDAIVIGLTYYDVERSYGKGVNRTFMHVDRYDMYNPYLQYTGDQEIYGEEYDARNDGTFGYVPAYEEFKQVINEADGGFMTALPGYAFIDEIYKKSDKDNVEYPDGRKNGPDFIRSKPVEFDRFYQKLTGHSLANKFHFIVDYYNEISAKRRMAFNPGVTY